MMYLFLFSIIYAGWAHSEERTRVGFTTDYNSLYIASKQGVNWGFSQVNTFIIAQIK